ncbi:hypothetical protein GN958_ATG17266 [Phytophthora infestans]|uniref:Uncharacterized protein n=1 Tax=Phytophthora infestans TaxID=4787 RepID=A0A8S9U1D6_PHYIN|nr:hypothetical protein GN958_ATG17266 [Phytophthora infestans]
MKRKGDFTRTGEAKKVAHTGMVEDDQAAMAELVRETTRAGKSTPTFWDPDGVDGGKSFLRVVLDWLSDPSNYDKWRGSDRTNGQTKEALLKLKNAGWRLLASSIVIVLVFARRLTLLRNSTGRRRTS